MFNFLKKKKTYLVEWNWGPTYSGSYTQLVKAVDKVDAWKKIENQHYSFITLISIREIKDEEN